ncbi:MAG: Crp/Fnr family transcriptional regulator [Clostridia bacterium]|nr:Crp/Fnr family transcriptional regulator [Clostridia bacterium]
MHIDREAIRKNMPLCLLNEEDVQDSIADGSFRLRAYNKNNAIHFPGDLCDKLEITLSGKVVIESIDEDGNLTAIAEFFAESILGGNLLFSKAPYYPMMITAKDSTLVLEIKKERLLQLFSGNLEFLKAYLEYTADHVSILGDRIQYYSNKSIRKKMINFLEYEGKRQQSSHIKLLMTKKALSEKIGVQRTSLSRELSKMRTEGLIRYDKKTIDILWRD